MTLEADGFALLPAVFSADEVQAIATEWDGVCSRHAADRAILAGETGPAYGARDLLRLWPRVIELARHPRLLPPLQTILGPGGGVVRALYFDKPPGHSWALPWHKDYTVAVKEYRTFGVFSKPTKKAGVPHVEAPVELLRRMVTARIHLDPMGDENGALRVLPGSHESAVVADDRPRPPVAVHCAAGDVLLMRPLLTHSSGHCRPDTQIHRRIVHLECAPTPTLPDGYKWHDFAPLG